MLRSSMVEKTTKFFVLVIPLLRCTVIISHPEVFKNLRIRTMPQVPTEIVLKN